MIVTASDPDRWRGFEWRSGWLDRAPTTEYAWRSRRVASSTPPVPRGSPDAGGSQLDLHAVRARARRRRGRSGSCTGARPTTRTFQRTRFSPGAEPRLRRPRNRNSGALHSSGRPRLPRVHEGEERRAGPAQPTGGSSSSGWTSTSTHVGRSRADLHDARRPRGIHVIGEHYIEDGDTYKMTEWLRAFCKSRGIVRSRVTVYPDASGKARAPRGRATTRSSERAASGLTRLERTRRFVIASTW